MVEPEWRIQQAFLQLEFAIKTMLYFERGDIDQAAFDSSAIIRLPEGDLRYPDSSFNTYKDLILAAQNLYSTVLGFSAISLEAALVDAGIRNDPADTSPRGDLRTLIYQIRCAFAHDMMYPKWRVDGRYRRQLNANLNGSPFLVDLSALDGQPFELEHVGGMLGYLAVKKEVLEWIREQSG